MILYYAQEQKMAEKLIFLTPDITDEILYLAFSKKRENGDLHLKFSKALKNFKETKEYQEYLNKHNIQ